jgi:hypothetical protein
LRTRRKRREKAAVKEAKAATALAAAKQLTPDEEMQFNAKTEARVVAHARAIKEAAVVEKLSRQKASAKYADVDTDAFRQQTQARVIERQLSLYQLSEPGTRPARVAVVGAGPAGLWIAVLLAREHATLYPRAGLPVRSSGFDRNLYARVPLVPTPARLKFLQACDQWHASRVSAAFLPFIPQILPKHEGTNRTTTWDACD